MSAETVTADDLGPMCDEACIGRPTATHEHNCVAIDDPATFWPALTAAQAWALLAELRAHRARAAKLDPLVEEYRKCTSPHQRDEVASDIGNAYVAEEPKR